VALVVLLAASAYGLDLLMNSRTVQLYGGITHRVETSAKVVALTFDDGPAPAGADRLLDTLDRAGVPATFYLTGSELAEYPELGARIAAAGHEIGNHSYSHQRMVLVSPGFVAEEVERTDALIRKTGYDGEITFRPPNGKKLLTLPRYLAEHDRRTITCDVEPDSYPDVASSADRIVDHAVERVRPGSIILLHAMYPSREQSLLAVGPLIERLQERGYEFVTVSQLLAAEGT
jgi:peptidoglycan/xylan/chitin deacetylase (PgdA/CDA1 family)